jgi:protein-disulfide isomerase
MKPSHILLATAAILASGACNAKNGGNAATGDAAESKAVEAVKPPANGDWSTVTVATSAGGFMMGNPDAKVKLIEYGSMTCPVFTYFSMSTGAPSSSKALQCGQDSEPISSSFTLASGLPIK